MGERMADAADNVEVSPERDGAAPIASAVGLSVRYGRGARAVLALDSVSMRVSAGELLVVRGPSGAGKTTLLLALAGLLRTTQGCVMRDGVALDSRRGRGDLGRGVGFVFQTMELLPYLDVVGNVALGLPGVARRQARARAEEALANLGLAERRQHRPGRLSAGEVQRVAVARALVSQPRLVLADEPTGALDSAHAARVLESLDAVRRRGGAVVLVTHADALPIEIDRELVMDRGQVASGGGGR